MRVFCGLRPCVHSRGPAGTRRAATSATTPLMWARSAPTNLKWTEHGCSPRSCSWSGVARPAESETESCACSSRGRAMTRRESRVKQVNAACRLKTCVCVSTDASATWTSWARPALYRFLLLRTVLSRRAACAGAGRGSGRGPDTRPDVWLLLTGSRTRWYESEKM